MENEYYGIATTPTDDYLAHYGIKGMKWGVRKAIERGGRSGERALGKQYMKAQKKLAKLEKRALSGRKYAKRAAVLGAGAAGAGALAVGGTKLAGRAAGALGQGMQTIGYGANRVLGKHLKGSVGNAIRTANTAIGKAGQAVAGSQRAINEWGAGQNALGQQIKVAGRKFQNSHGALVAKATGGKGIVSTTDKLATNNNMARLGAGLAGLGLAAGAGYNTYRAATTKRAAKKAAAFRAEMNKAFAGTKFANGVQPRQGKKRRRG